jgi:transaldolase
MKFFIDTANLAQIKEANELGILDGVTTNPSLMAKEGIKGEVAVMQHYKTICEMVDGDISAEVISTDFEGIIEEGKKLVAIHKNIVVKVPMIKSSFLMMVPSLAIPRSKSLTPILFFETP